jgi:four helix bundle protein
MEKINSYRELIAWQRAMDLAAAVYDASRDWPREERYGLTSQARRSAVSIPANIAEGYGRESTNAYLNFLRIARGSLRELETQLLIAQRVGVAESTAIEPLLRSADELGKILHGLIRKVETAV